MHLLTHSAILRALGWSLFNSLWQMGLLWAIYSVTILLFRHWPARIRHGLLLLLLSAGTLWSLLTFVSAYWLAPGDSYTLSSLLSGQDGFPFLAAGRRLAAELLPYCSTLYLLVLFVLLIRYARRYQASRRLARNGLSAASPELNLFVATTARRMGIRPAIGIYISGLANVPVTLGFLKPLILVPVSMVTRLTPGQIEAIVVHELAHIRRQDYLIHLLTSVQELLFFFNPFTRLLITQLRKEREYSCDDQVLQFRYDPSTYVSALLSLARHHHEGRLAVAAVDGGEKLLLQRARKILQQKRAEPRRDVGFFVLSLLTLGLMAAALYPTRTITLQPTIRTITLQPTTRTITAQLTRTITAQPTTRTITLQPNIRTIILQPNIRTITAQPTRTIILQPTTRTASAPSATTTIRSALEMPAPVIRNTAVGSSSISSDKSGKAATASAQSRRVRHTRGTRIPEGATDLPGYGSFTILTADPDPTPAFAQLVQIDDRDYSLETPGSQNAGSPASDDETTVQPYVPASSFAFQLTDTLAPAEKLAMLQQQLAEKEVVWQLARLQLLIEQQKKLDAQRQAAVRAILTEKAVTGVVRPLEKQRLKIFFQQEQDLRVQYLKSLNDLQRQLKKAGRRLTIVYI